MIKLLKEKGISNIPVIIGGIVPGDDMAELLEIGISKAFGPGSHASEIIEHIKTQ